MKQKLRQYGLKAVALIAGLVILLSAGGTATIAWLTGEADPLTNKFGPANVPPEIVEEFDGETKQNVKVKNIGNIDGFMRATLSAVWLTEAGDIAPDAVDPLVFDQHANWFYHEGFYYYKIRVAPGETTENLIDAFGLPTKAGLRFELQVIASSIQADPDEAVEHAWPVQVNASGQLEPAGP